MKNLAQDGKEWKGVVRRLPTDRLVLFTHVWVMRLEEHIEENKKQQQQQQQQQNKTKQTKQNKKQNNNEN